VKPASELPRGTWMYVRNLPVDCTDERLSELFVSLGVNIPPENVSIKQNHKTGATAIVCITRDILADTLNWILSQSSMNGRPVVVEPVLPGHKPNTSAAE